MSVGAPEARNSAGIHVYHWQAEQVSIRVERLSESRDEVSGEITVRTSLPAVPPHLHQARLNLTSTTSRRTLARALSDRLPLPWDDFLEYACILTLQAYRQGEPIIQVGHLPVRGGAAYRLWPLVRDGEPSVVYGDGGVGKSFLGALALLLVTTGRTAAGLNAHPEPTKGLYLDWESSAEELDERVKGLRAGMSLPEDIELSYRFSTQPLAHELPEIQRAVTEGGYNFLVVDSLGLACGGDPESAQVILAYFAALRSLRLGSLTLHHIPKDKDRGPFGSAYIKNMARNAWEMKKEQEEDSDTLYIGLYHTKVNRGRRLRPLGIRLTFREDGAIVPQTQDILQVPLLATGASLKDRLRDALSHGQRTVHDLAEELDKSENEVRARLHDSPKLFTTAGNQGRETLWGLRYLDSEETTGGR